MTGWAGLPRHIARQRARTRIEARTARIDELAALLAQLQTEQTDDLTLLDQLDRPEDGPLVRHRWRPRSTGNGEDDHVPADQWREP